MLNPLRHAIWTTLGFNAVESANSTENILFKLFHPSTRISIYFIGAGAFLAGHFGLTVGSSGAVFVLMVYKPTEFDPV